MFSPGAVDFPEVWNLFNCFAQVGHSLAMGGLDLNPWKHLRATSKTIQAKFKGNTVSSKTRGRYFVFCVGTRIIAGCITRSTAILPVVRRESGNDPYKQFLVGFRESCSGSFPTTERVVPYLSQQPVMLVFDRRGVLISGPGKPPAPFFQTSRDALLVRCGQGIPDAEA